MWIKNIVILLATSAAMAVVVAAKKSSYDQDFPIFGGAMCHDGYIPRKGCGPTGWPICCPPKNGSSYERHENPPDMPMKLDHLRGNITDEELKWKEENCVWAMDRPDVSL